MLRFDGGEKSVWNKFSIPFRHRFIWMEWDFASWHKLSILWRLVTELMD